MSFWAIVLIATMGLSTWEAQAGSSKSPIKVAEGPIEARQLLVSFSKMPSLAQRRAVFSKWGVSEVSQVGQSSTFKVEALNKGDLEKARLGLQKELGITGVEQNLRSQTFH